VTIYTNVRLFTSRMPARHPTKSVRTVKKVSHSTHFSPKLSWGLSSPSWPLKAPCHIGGGLPSGASRQPSDASTPVCQQIN